jgi:hypothetical protein
MHPAPIGKIRTVGQTTRRHVVVGLMTGAGLLSFGGLHKSVAQTLPSGAGRNAALSADESFFKLSQTLTGHADIDRVTASRLSAGFARIDPDILAALKRLAPLAEGQDPAGVMKAADAAGLGSAARGLTAAWYTGTIGSGPTAEVISDVDALMNRTVRDAMAPETYCFGGPAWWVQPPPPVGVSTPIEAAATRSAATASAEPGKKAQ